MRLDQADRLLGLVGCLDKPTEDDAGDVWRYMTTLREWNPDWFEPATDLETVALRLRHWDPGVLRAESLARYPQNGAASPVWYRDRVLTAKRLLGAEPSPTESTSESKALSGRLRAERLAGPIHPAFLAALKAFRKESLNAGHHLDRVQHAIRRFLGPFCAWARSNGQCTGWHQLSKKKQRIAFQAGLAAERAWLGSLPRSKRKVIPPPESIDPAITSYRTEKRAAQQRRGA